MPKVAARPRWLVGFGLFSIALIIWLLAPFQFMLAQDGGSPPLEIDIQYRARHGGSNPVSIAGKDITTVTVSLQAPEVCPSSTVTKPIDVVLVLDVSGSMNDAADEGITKLAASQNAALAFINQLGPQDQISIVSFSSGSDVEIGLTHDLDAARAAVQNLGIGGGTNIPSGIESAANVLAGPEQNAEGGAIPIIVLLSDGQNDPSSVAEAADRARRILNDVRIAGIGFGPDAERATFEAMADPGLAFFTTSADELIQIYQNLVTLVQPRVNATNITVTFIYDRVNYELQPNTLNPPGQVEGDQLIWELSALDEGESAQYSFDVRSTSIGASSVGRVEVRYIPCEQTNFRVDPVDSPLLDTLLPTATPTATATATATITPTPLPTGTPLPPNALGPGPNGEITADGVTSNYCTDNTWNTISWIVAVVIFTLVLLVVLWLASRVLASNRSKNLGTWLCLLLGSLMLLYAAILGFFFLPPMVGQACDPPESVYFWRMDGDTAGIFLSHPDLTSSEPAQVKEFNDFGCVGCHIVNDESERMAGVIGPAPGRVAIFTLDGERLDRGPITAVYLAFSPDGERLAFSDENGDIYLVTVLDGQLINLVGASDPAYAEIMPTWSPDGRSIAFVRGAIEDMGPSGLYINDRADIFIAPIDGSSPPIPLAGASGSGVNYYPSYSPDGRWLAYTRNDTGRTYDNPNADIMIISTTSGAPQRIAANSDASDSWAAWSHDSQWIAFQSNRNDDNYDVFIARIAEDGSTDEAVPLQHASESGVKEYRPFWGEPIARISLWEELQPLLPLLLPLGLLFLAWALVCSLWPKPTEGIADEDTPPSSPSRPEVVPPNVLNFEHPLQVLWEPQPTLVIGLGKAGRWVLTHLKKTLLDAGVGHIPREVVLLCIAAGEHARRSSIEHPTYFQFGGVELGPDEIIEWRDNLKGLVENAANDYALQDWVQPETLRAVAERSLDPIRGFDNRRVLGRAALINNLRGNYRETEVSVWERLQQAARQARSANNRLMVMLVADLSDDIGSGSFLDIAYLVKQLEQPLGLAGITLIGHFVTEHALGQGNSQRNQVNTYAALRELARFELATTYAFPMTYSAQKETPHSLNGIVNKRLFDELNLYDRPLRGERNQPAPETAILPAIADGIALWMDKATRTGQVKLLQRQLAQVGAVQQVRYSELMFSTMGIFQYRLPFADLLDSITARYARELIQYLLMGGLDNMDTLHEHSVTDPFILQNQLTPEMLAQEFLRGRFSFIETLGASWQAVLRYLFAEPDDMRLLKAVTDFKKDPANEQPVLQQWLRNTLLLFLNGIIITEQTEEPDYVQLRSGKLGLAIAVLRKLGGQDRQTGIISQAAQRIRAIAPDVKPEIANQLDEWSAYAVVLRKHLETIGNWLGSPPLGESVYGYLEQRESRLRESRTQMEALATRRYVWNDAQTGEPLQKVWYKTYLQDHIFEGVGAFHWQEYDGNIYLMLRMPQIAVNDTENVEDIRLVVSAPDDRIDQTRIRAFAEKLLEMGRVFGSSIRETETLSKVLQYAQLSKASINATAENLYKDAEIGLATQRNIATTESVVLSANVNMVDQTKTLGDVIKQRLNRPDLLTVLETTDPYTLTLVKRLDVVPQKAIDSIHTDYGAYLNATGINRGEQPENAIPVSVFGAEARALNIELGLKQLRESARLLHPVVTTFLAYPLHTSVFLMALASSKAAQLTRNNGVRFDTEQLRIVLVPDNTSPAPVATALEQFIKQADLQIVEKLYDYYFNDDPYLDEWEEWYNEGFERWLTTGLVPEDRQIVKDLITVTRVLVNRVL